MPSNREFLNVLAASAPKGAQFGTCSFTQNPNTAPPHVWFAQPWAPGEVPAVHPEANNYFTVSCYWPGPDGRFRRKSENFAALCALVLDDLRTKGHIPPSAPALSWLLETSPGNFQGGLFLREPVTDAALAARLMNAVIKKGLCDPGASGPTARYARLSQGFNSKHSPPFICRLHEWRPDVRYTVEEITEGFGLDLTPPQAPKPRHRSFDRTQGNDGARLAAAAGQLDPNDYRDWMAVLAGCKGAQLLGDVTEETACAIWWQFSEAASEAKRAKADDPRYDPAQLWANFTPSAPPAALVGALYARARDKAAETVRRETTEAGELSESGLAAARYLAAHHRQAFKQLVDEGAA